MWQSLVRNLLYDAARRAATQHVNQAAAAPGDPAANPEAHPAPPAEQPPCHVGVVFALSIEAGGLVDRLSGVVSTQGEGFVAREGGLDGRRVVIVEAGAGRQAAASGALALIAGHKPRWVISAGFAGALAPGLQAGDIVMPDRLADEAGNELELDFKIDAAARAANPRLHVGRLLTVDRIVATPAEKLALGERHAALAVDMESLAVAQACAERKVRFMAVRVISDAVDRELPAEVDNLLRQKTRAGRLGAAAAAIFNRPTSVRDMWQLKEDALVASERLAKFLTGIIAQLG